MKNNYKKGLAVLTVGALAFGIATQQAQALSVKLTTTGEADFVVNDNGAGDSVPATGQINFSKSNFGGWNLNTEIATTKPLIGSATSPAMSLNSFNATTAAGAVNPLTIFVTETSFTGSPLSFLGLLNASFNSGITIQYKAYADAANGVFGTGSTLFDSGSISPAGTVTGFSTLSSSQSFASPYSLTLELILTAGNDKSVSFDSSLRGVPDGGMTLSLFGFALLGVEAARRKFKSSKV